MNYIIYWIVTTIALAPCQMSQPITDKWGRQIISVGQPENQSQVLCTQRRDAERFMVFGDSTSAANFFNEVPVEPQVLTLGDHVTSKRAVKQPK